MDQSERLVVGNINSALTVIGGQDGRLTLAAPGAAKETPTHGAKANGAWTWIGFTSETSGFAIDGAESSSAPLTAGRAGRRSAFTPDASASRAALLTCRADDLRGGPGRGRVGRRVSTCTSRSATTAPPPARGQPRVTAAGQVFPRRREGCCGLSSAGAAPVVVQVGAVARLTIEADNQLCRDDANAAGHGIATSPWCGPARRCRWTATRTSTRPTPT